MKPLPFVDLLDALEGVTVRYDLARSYAMPADVDSLPERVVDGVLYWQAFLAEYCAAVCGWPDGTHRIPLRDWQKEIRWQEARGKFDAEKPRPVPAKVPPLRAAWYTGRAAR